MNLTLTYPGLDELGSLQLSEFRGLKHNVPTNNGGLAGDGTCDVSNNDSVDSLTKIWTYFTSVPFCGDGILEGAEGCDPGVPPSEACAYGVEPGSETNTCASDCGGEVPCTVSGYCGDGVIQSDHEECDGSAAAGSVCNADCTLTMFQVGIAGHSGGCEFHSLDAAIAAAVIEGASTIYVGADLIGADATITTSLPATLTIESSDDGCLSSSALVRGLDLLGSPFVSSVNTDLTLRSLYIADGGDPVIEVTGGSLLMEDSVVDGASGDLIYLVDTDATVTRSDLVGGLTGIVVTQSSGVSAVTASEVVFEGNSWAINALAGTVRVDGHSFIQHTTSAPAVSASGVGTSVTIVQSTVSGNATGGGLVNVGSAVNVSGGALGALENVLVTGHPAGAPALRATGAGTSLSVMQTTIAGNGGRGFELASAATMALKNSIDQENGLASSVPAGTSVTGSCVNRKPFQGVGFVGIAPVKNAAPLFVGGGNYRLTNASPSVDQCAFGIRPDLDGVLLLGASYDQGAYESF